MAQRLRLYDFRVSDGPRILGNCQADLPRCAQIVNRAQERLLTCREVGDEGWNGTFAEMVFNVQQTNPYITTPRGVARLEVFDVCGHPVPIENQFYEYLEFGNGRMPRNFCTTCRDFRRVLSRNYAPTFLDLSPAPQIVRVRASDPADMDGKHRVLVQGIDFNGNVVYSQDGLSQVSGIFVTLTSPFVDVPFQMNEITGIQKDVTSGPVSFFQVDASANEVQLLSMEPTETTAWYRRYFIHSLPRTCCAVPSSPPGTVQVRAIAKLDLVPAFVDTDYLLLQSLEAIIEEGQSMRYEEMDSAAAKQMAAVHHLNAVRYLQGELVHVYGKIRPAVNNNPFGTARLENQRIGVMI